MDLDELRSVRRTERESSTLQHLRDSFYRDVADYVERRKDDYRRQMAEADDPFAASEEVEHIKDEVETAEDVAEAIYERRVGKVVKMAAFAAADMSTDEEGLTAEERELFDDLVGRIRQNRETVLATLAGEGPSSSADAVASDEGGAEPTPGANAGEATPDPTVPDAPGGDEGGVLSEAMGGADGTDGSPDGADGPTPEASVPGPADASASDSPDASVPGPADASADTAGPVDGPGPADGAGPAVGGDPIDAGTEGPRTDPGPDPHEDPSPPGEAPAPTLEASGTADGGSPSGTGDARAGSDADGAGPTGTTDRVTVRLTSDVGSIFGVDEREYDLASEDVVTLPTTNAQPLLDRGAAERLDGG